MFDKPRIVLTFPQFVYYIQSNMGTYVRYSMYRTQIINFCMLRIFSCLHVPLPAKYDTCIPMRGSRNIVSGALTKYFLFHRWPYRLPGKVIEPKGPNASRVGGGG